MCRSVLASPLAALVLAALVLVHCGAAAQAAARVSRPPLPSPMPQLVTGACPGLEDEATGCHVGAGDADAHGVAYPHGAVFVDGHRFTLYHELGHAFDDTMMDEGERTRFASLLGWVDMAWSSTYVDEQGRLIQAGSSLAEVFADAYANCRMGRIVGPGHLWEVGYDYYPTESEHRHVCGMITRAGNDQALVGLSRHREGRSHGAGPTALPAFDRSG